MKNEVRKREIQILSRLVNRKVVIRDERVVTPIGHVPRIRNWRCAGVGGTDSVNPDRGYLQDELHATNQGDE